MTLNEMESDRYGQKVGRLMRILQMEASGADLNKHREVEWKRSGLVMLNTKEPKRGALRTPIDRLQ